MVRMLFLSEPLFEKSVAIAADIQKAVTAALKMGLGIAFGIEFDQLQPVSGGKRSKGNEVILCHGMINGEKIFVFNTFYSYSMIFISFLGLKGRQRHSAAADERIACGMQHIAAYRADIQLKPHKVTCAVRI